jgi:quercetin dioxygenase-like cupin family protein
METINKPETAKLTSGESFRVLQVTGWEGMLMPLHHSTGEAVVIVLEGSAVLKIDENEHLLQEGGAFIIPANQNHSLTLHARFKALVAMSKDSNIEFVN